MCRRWWAPTQTGQAMTRSIMESVLPRPEARLRQAIWHVADGTIADRRRTVEKDPRSWNGQCRVAQATLAMVLQVVTRGGVREITDPEARSPEVLPKLLHGVASLIVVGVQSASLIACTGQRPLAVTRADSRRHVVGFAAGTESPKDCALLDLRSFLQSGSDDPCVELGRVIGRMLHPALVSAVLINAPGPLLAAVVRISPGRLASEVVMQLENTVALTQSIEQQAKAATLLGAPASLMHETMRNLGVTLEDMVSALQKVYEDVPLAAIGAFAAMVRGGKNEKFPHGTAIPVNTPGVPFPLALCLTG